MKIYIR